MCESGLGGVTFLCIMVMITAAEAFCMTYSEQSAKPPSVITREETPLSCFYQKPWNISPLLLRLFRTKQHSNNNNSLDDNLQPDKRPAVSSVHLGASWKLNELSEPG